MNEIVDAAGWRKVDSLRELIAQLEVMPVWVFHNETWRFDRDDPGALEQLTATGGTNLAGALRQLRHQGYRRVLILTDGIADDEWGALAEAPNFDEITVRYIGLPPTPIFLTRLSDAAAASRGCEAVEFGRGKAKALAVEFLQLAHF
jgi:hypothetical protein